jgi:hypothetical protein
MSPVLLAKEAQLKLCLSYCWIAISEGNTEVTSSQRQESHSILACYEVFHFTHPFHLQNTW